MFQTSAPPTTTPNASATKASPSPASAASATPSTLLVDRSTDKMMIRANVNAAAPQPTRALPRATPVMTPHINPRMTPNESMQNEKEIEELKTLKKELQELKALKNNSGSGDLPEPELDEEGQVLDPAYNYDANGFPAQNPGGNPLSNPGIHPQGIPQGGEPPLVR
ncbi:MAG: hypothetical protein H7333_08035 [Bdellovibrionales bacterium]|nr:hypothetical protein [Oligoflexia bacterium]